MTSAEKTVKDHTKIVLILMLVVAALYVIAVTTAPVRKIAKLNQLVSADSVLMAKNQHALKYRSLFELTKAKSLKEAELVLAQKDTFGLVVNLTDSTMLLMLKGVEIHRSKIYDYKKDQFFNALNPLLYSNLFSQPLRTQHEFSTIVKEPIIIKKAPKDTIEAITNAYMPDTLVQNPAYLRLELEHGFNLILVQRVFKTAEEKQTERQFKRDIQRRKSSDIFRNFIHWSNVSYSPNIVLYLNADEMRSAYRAIPEDALVVLSY